MTLLLARHQVADAEQFIQGYNSSEAKEVREKYGVKNDAVYGTVENGNDVLVVHYFDSVEQANTFLATDELKEAMTALGVIGEPKLQVFNSL